MRIKKIESELALGGAGLGGLAAWSSPCTARALAFVVLTGLDMRPWQREQRSLSVPSPPLALSPLPRAPPPPVVRPGPSLRLCVWDLGQEGLTRCRVAPCACPAQRKVRRAVPRAGSWGRAGASDGTGRSFLHKNVFACAKHASDIPNTRAAWTPGTLSSLKRNFSRGFNVAICRFLVLFCFLCDVSCFPT